MKPVIAIVGRPNVGKSTLFNRLLQNRKAIVEDEPGVTRDRIYGEATWDDHPFILIDTGGIEAASREHLKQQIREQAEVAIQEADVILFLMDGKEGLMPADHEVADLLRRAEKPVFYAVNKVDGERWENGVIDFYRLGADPLYSISAEHGRGVGDLMEKVFQTLPAAELEEEKKGEEIRVALVGRPNVGKSSLLNRLLGKQRAVVDSVAGTTRDAIDTPVIRDGRKYIFIDTAGIRRKAKITLQLEKYSAIHALRSLDRCDVAAILLDGFEGLTEQDARIAEIAAERGRAILLVVNKWDLVQKETSTMVHYEERIREELKTLDYVPVLFISALTGQRVSKIFAAIDAVTAEHRRRITTADLNKFLLEATQSYASPQYHNHPVKLYYISQVKVAPPTFVIFVNQPLGVGEPYRRYLTRRMRERYGFSGTPIRLLFRQRTKEKKG